MHVPTIMSWSRTSQDIIVALSTHHFDIRRPWLHQSIKNHLSLLQVWPIFRDCPALLVCRSSHGRSEFIGWGGHLLLKKMRGNQARRIEILSHRQVQCGLLHPSAGTRLFFATTTISRVSSRLFSDHEGICGWG